MPSVPLSLAGLGPHTVSQSTSLDALSLGCWLTVIPSPSVPRSAHPVNPPRPHLSSPTQTTHSRSRPSILVAPPLLLESRVILNGDHVARVPILDPGMAGLPGGGGGGHRGCSLTLSVNPLPHICGPALLPGPFRTSLSSTLLVHTPHPRSISP